MSTRTISVYSSKSTESGEARPAGLPLTRDLTLAYNQSLVVALLMTLASIAGLLYQRTLYPADELLLSFVPSDGFNLALGLPVLLGSIWLARRGVLIGLAILIIVRQTALAITALTTRTSVATIELSTLIADFMVAAPMLLLAGIQLWRREALGYAAGAGTLLGYGMLALSLIPFFVLQARHTAAPLDAGDMVTILVMAAVCFIPLAFFLRGATCCCVILFISRGAMP